MWGDRRFRQIMNYGQGKRWRCRLLAVSVGTVRAHLVAGTEHLGDTSCYVMYHFKHLQYHSNTWLMSKTEREGCQEKA